MARTREEERERKRLYRAKKRAELQPATQAPARPGHLTAVAIVTPIGAPPAPAGRDDSVLAAVEEEVAQLPLARKHPADVAAAKAMARVLDDSSSVPQHPSAAARLKVLMDGLRAEADSGRSKLQTLRDSRSAR